MAAMAAKTVIAKDLPEVISTMREMGEKVSDIDQHVESLLKKILSGSLATKKGISFLELKFHLLLSYVIDLTYYMLTKTDGKSWQQDPAVERLVEVRTVLEKLRPIDQKMKYQIDKMIKAATTGMVSGAEIDPLRFKPNPDNMVRKLDDEESESSDEDAPKKSKVYVPPKVAAVPYDEDDDKKTRKERDEERARKRVLTSSLLQDLRDEYGDTPQEIRDETVSRWRKQKEKEEEEERTRYEEENLLRLPAKKKKKISEHVQSGMDELTSFADLSVLNMEQDARSGEYLAKSSSSSKKSKSKWKKKFGSAKRKKGLFKRRRR